MQAGRQWYVVHTKPRREAYAQEQLVRRGVETFFPRIIESRPVKPLGLGPLFPSYLFARISLERQYSRVIWSPGVRNLVTFGAAPTPLEDEVVNFIKVRCGSEGVLAVRARLHEGGRVRVKKGALEGLVGTVQGEMDGRRRVGVLMEILRRQTRVVMRAELLEHLDA